MSDIITKQACLINISNGELLSIIELKGSQKQFDDWNTWPHYVFIFPSAKLIKAFKEGSGIPFWDKNTQKWSLKKFDNSKLQEEIKQLHEEIDSTVSDRLREGSFEYKGSHFSTSIKKTLEYLELFVLASTGVIDFPVSVKTNASGNTIIFRNIDEFKNFMREFYLSKMSIVTAGRILKYGGNDTKPISDFTFAEVNKFNVESSLDSIIVKSVE